MEKIILTSKEELNIFINPMRQRLLRVLSLNKTPMTPKMLADKLNISASGVQHHLKKLISLGVVELNHTEMINGIKASYYKPTHVLVRIGLDQSGELDNQREVLCQDLISQVYDGYIEQMKKVVSANKQKDSEVLAKWGDILTGVIHLEPGESETLLKLIRDFLQQHEKATSTSHPWEYAIIAYNATEDDND